MHAWNYACPAHFLHDPSPMCPGEYENTPFDPSWGCFATVQNELMMAAKSGCTLGQAQMGLNSRFSLSGQKREKNVCYANSFFGGCLSDKTDILSPLCFIEL